MKMEIYRRYAIGNRVDLVERLLDRDILADATRKITRNRQPGRCCSTGCFTSDAPQTVSLVRIEPARAESEHAAAAATATTDAAPVAAD